MNVLMNSSNSDWKEHQTQDGRKFYYNSVSKESTWEKPDILKSPEELQCDWTEYFNKEGKPYYYNSKTKKSQWEKPKEFIEIMEKKRQMELNKKPSQLNLMNTIPLPMTLPLAPSIPRMIPINPLQEMDQKLKEIEEKKRMTALEIENLPKEEIDRLFKDMLRRVGVTSTWKWEDCERVLYGEEVWKAVKTFSEKRTLFNDYVRECKNKEREELRLKRDKLKIKFRQMLEEESPLTSDTKFAKVIMKFCHDERWRAIDEREREELYQDYMDELEKRENEEKRMIRENKAKAFRKILEDRRLPSNTKWKDILLNFREDPLFASMEKIDRLKTFADYITELENKEKEEKETSRKFMEYRNRENFRELLIEKVNANLLTAETKWKPFILTIKDSVEYLNLIGQEGSTPKDLFDDVVIKLKQIYKKNKEVLKKILKVNAIKFSHETNFEDFNERLKEYEEYVAMKDDIKLTLYIHLIKKLKEKEKHLHKIIKKTNKKLELFFKRGKIEFNKETLLEDVIDSVRNHSRFSVLSNEKIKVVFDSMKEILIEEGENAFDDYRYNNDDDTSSESGQIKRKKNRKKKKGKKKRCEDSKEEVNFKKRRLDGNTKKNIEVFPEAKTEDVIMNEENINVAPSEKEDGETSD